jgi:phage gpG-like protein
MANVSFRVTRDDIRPALAKMLATAKNPEKVMRSMGTTFMSITMGNFNDSDYRPSPWVPKKNGSPSNLKLNNVLSRSFHLSVTSTTATVSTPEDYAAIHQFGGTIKPKKGPYLMFEWAPGKWAKVKEVIMPARPFFPVENGVLTPRAEEKIAAAGQRALAREIGATGP